MKCKTCGKHFDQKMGNQKHCSKACREKACRESKRRPDQRRYGVYDEKPVIELLMDGVKRSCGEVCKIVKMPHYVVSGILSRLACRNIIHKNKSDYPFTYRAMNAPCLLELYFHDGGKTHAADLLRLRSSLDHNKNCRVHRSAYSLHGNAHHAKSDGGTNSGAENSKRTAGIAHALGVSVAQERRGSDVLLGA